MIDLSTLTPSVLVRLYNEVTGEAVARFADRAKGARRLYAALNQNGLEVALVGGEPKVRPVKSRFVDMPAAEPVVSPGLARLRASQNADAIRELTIAEGEKARELVVRPVEPEPAVEAPAPFVGAGRAKKAAELRVEALPAPAEKPAKVSRYATEAVIRAVVPNPKKPGSRAFAYFSQYREGQTLADFIAACVDAGLTEKDARANISWDARKGFIKLSTDPVAPTRPGDAAAIYAAETGVDYATALARCNMD